MKKNSNQVVLICLTLAATAVISWVLFFKQAVEKDTVDINHFPKKIGAWDSVDLRITKDEYAILETNNAFVRLYTNAVDKAQVTLYLVYSQTNRKVAHPPEICYTGNGLTITEDVHDTIPVKYKNLTIQANRLRLVKGNFTQFAYYWFKVGEHFTSNYWKEQVLIAFYTLLGRQPSSALVRVSADVVDNDVKKTITNMKNFINLIAPELFLYLPGDMANAKCKESR
jgi:EpsI family protein